MRPPALRPRRAGRARRSLARGRAPAETNGPPRRPWRAPLRGSWARGRGYECGPTRWPSKGTRRGSRAGRPSQSRSGRTPARGPPRDGPRRRELRRQRVRPGPCPDPRRDPRRDAQRELVAPRGRVVGLEGRRHDDGRERRRRPRRALDRATSAAGSTGRPPLPGSPWVGPRRGRRRPPSPYRVPRPRAPGGARQSGAGRPRRGRTRGRGRSRSFPSARARPSRDRARAGPPVQDFDAFFSFFFFCFSFVESFGLLSFLPLSIPFAMSHVLSSRRLRHWPRQGRRVIRAPHANLHPGRDRVGRTREPRSGRAGLAGRVAGALRQPGPGDDPRREGAPRSGRRSARRGGRPAGRPRLGRARRRAQQAVRAAPARAWLSRHRQEQHLPCDARSRWSRPG